MRVKILNYIKLHNVPRTYVLPTILLCTEYLPTILFVIRCNCVFTKVLCSIVNKSQIGRFQTPKRDLMYKRKEEEKPTMLQILRDRENGFNMTEGLAVMVLML